MEAKEAILSLKNIIQYWIHKPTEVEVAKLAIKALEKQVPKTPDGCHVRRGVGQCPNCISNSVTDNFRYCPQCGQKLDWGD